ncbi:hypothetical protein HMN09_01080200 [Mycena chlorophos]|uniref:DUF6534 domain-containing protein n=1 Tax=Mycena chlorophos TaxID=658473 RepID=A0A8H6SDG7_MYCCL|nr:hypothetical protein HMN09_01080200 [Mycena chlorophos]
MSAATLQLGQPLDNTMGSMLLGVIVSAVLYGISLLQCLFYFTRYTRDPPYLKALVKVAATSLSASWNMPQQVATTVLLDSVHLAFVTHTIYHYLITQYYFQESLKVMVWSVSLEAVPTGVTGSLVQLFYAHRVWKMSHKNKPLTALIVLIVLATSACGTAWVVLALEAGTYERLLKISPLTISINALSTTTDVIITTTLCFMLYRTRPASLETESMVNRLILFTINTGLLTSLCAVASLVSLVISPQTLIYASFYFCIGRLYSNALLASLNARAVIRGRINDVDSNFHIKSSALSANAAVRAGSGQGRRGELSREVFARYPNPNLDGSVSTPTELSVRIDRETRHYSDQEFSSKSDSKFDIDEESESLPQISIIPEVAAI